MQTVDGNVVLSAGLSATHLLTLALGLGALVVRGRALRRPLDDAMWRTLLTADNAWGAAAALWIGTGLARVFLGGKELAFYTHNAFFWVKMALFVLVFVLELTPMITFMRVRMAIRRRTPLPMFSVGAYRRINSMEVALVVTIVFAAALMARGAAMF